jgi:hypothetical protein
MVGQQELSPRIQAGRTVVPRFEQRFVELGIDQKSEIANVVAGPDPAGHLDSAHRFGSFERKRPLVDETAEAAFGIVRPPAQRDLTNDVALAIDAVADLEVF